MCGSDLLLFCFYLASAAESSSIITRSMIRMNTPSSLSSSSTFGEDSQPVLPEPAKLVSEPEEDKFQIIYPMHSELQDKERGVQSRSIERLNDTKDVKEVILEPEENLKQNMTKLNNITRIAEYLQENTTHPVTNNVLSSIELSRKYWEGYKNFSYDLLNNTTTSPEPVGERYSLQKGFQEMNIWEILQKFYNCLWSVGVISCIQESFTSPDTSETYLQFMIPRFPKFQENEGISVFDNDKFDMTPNEEEGRKKVSKVLQSVLPLLLMLKMSMLPALVMMALVTGKAFLLSLLSLGAALVAGSLPSVPGFSANKRHEVPAPSNAAPPDYSHHPNKYYWM